MDLVRAEIERKRKAIDLAKSSSKVKKIDGKRQFLKRGDLRRVEEEMECNDSKEIFGQSLAPRAVDENKNVIAEKGESTIGEEAGEVVEMGLVKVKKSLSLNEVTAALRSFGLPIRLFGETTKVIDESQGIYEDSRLTRLAAARELASKALATISENDEFRLGSGHEIRNQFLDKRKEEEEVNTSARDITVSNSTTKEISAVQDNTHDTSNDPHKQIHHFFKSLLKQWEDQLAQRPDAERRTIAGKNETKTLKQCRDYIRPLFKLCKSRKLEPSIMSHLVKIVSFCKQGEFVQAHNAYIDLSIGRAAWPIGVTMVGIHARTGRAKIESANVAHVMNSEVQRKYLTSVKRLMSYCQKLRPDVSPSKKVLT